MADKYKSCTLERAYVNRNLSKTSKFGIIIFSLYFLVSFSIFKKNTFEGDFAFKLGPYCSDPKEFENTQVKQTNTFSVIILVSHFSHPVPLISCQLICNKHSKHES